MVHHATVLPRESNGRKETSFASSGDISDLNDGMETGTSSPTTSAEGDSDGNDGMERHVPASHNALHLQRRVGLFSGVALIVGTMIGSGIFVSPSDLLKRTHSPGLFLVTWVACGILAMLGALSYAELGTMITQSGAEYAYFRQAFGPVPAFLFCWVCTLVLKPSQLAIICLAFAKYTVEAFVNECEAPDLTIKLLCASTIGLITFVNCFSVELATKVQNIFTAAKLVAIGIVVIAGLYKVASGNTQYLAQGFDGPKASIGDIATAFYSGLWAYDGWNNLNYVTEELKNPYVNLPRAILIGIPLTTVCYLMVNVAYLAVLSPSEMIASEAVAVTFGNRALGALAWLMPLAVCVSTFGSANGTLFVGGRLCYVASREGHLVDILSYVHVKRLTPSPALLFNSLIALAMIIPGDIGSLIDFFSFTAWIFYGGAMLALIVLRYTKKDAPRPYKVPIIIPVIVLIISVYLVIAPIIDDPKLEFLYATIFILAGFLVYVPFVHYKVVLPGMGRFTAFLQLALEVAPSSAAED